MDVPDGELVLGAGEALFGGEAVPVCSFAFVVRHSFTDAVASAEFGLRGQVVLACRFSVPFGSDDLVAGDAAAMAVEFGQFVLGGDVVLLGSFAAPPGCLPEVFARAAPGEVAAAEAVLRYGVAEFGFEQEPLEGFFFMFGVAVGGKEFFDALGQGVRRMDGGEPRC